MKGLIDFLNVLLPVLYITTFIFYYIDFMKGGKVVANSKRVFLFFTLIFHLFYLLFRTLYFEHPPITNVFEIFTVLAFAIGFSYFILELVTDIRGTGMFIIIISILFQLIIIIFYKRSTAGKRSFKKQPAWYSCFQCIARLFCNYDFCSLWVPLFNPL